MIPKRLTNNSDENYELKMAFDLMPFVHRGEKTITIREGWRNITPGELLISNADDENDFINVRHFRTIHTFARYVHSNEYKADGFESIDQMVEQMKMFYPDFNHDSQATIVIWFPPAVR